VFNILPLQRLNIPVTNVLSVVVAQKVMKVNKK